MPQKREVVVYVYLANIYATQSLVAHKIHFNEAMLKFPTIPKLVKSQLNYYGWAQKCSFSYRIQRHSVSEMPPKSFLMGCSSIESEHGTFSWPQDLAQTKSGRPLGQSCWAFHHSTPLPWAVSQAACQSSPPPLSDHHCLCPCLFCTSPSHPKTFCLAHTF